MTTRSTDKVLISGGTSSKYNINIPKSFKQSWDHTEMSESVCCREGIRYEWKTIDDMEFFSVYNRKKWIKMRRQSEVNGYLKWIHMEYTDPYYVYFHF